MSCGDPNISAESRYNSTCTQQVRYLLTDGMPRSPPSERTLTGESLQCLGTNSGANVTGIRESPLDLCNFNGAILTLPIPPCKDALVAPRPRVFMSDSPPLLYVQGSRMPSLTDSI